MDATASGTHDDAASDTLGAENSVSDEDLAACLRVLTTLATPEDGVSETYRTPRFKPLRCALQLYLEDAERRQFHGQKPDKYAQRKEKKREKNAREQQQRALDREAADKTRMRAERLKMLGSLEQSAAAAAGEGAALTFVPDGAVETTDEAPPLGLLTAAGGGADDDARGGDGAGEDGAKDGSALIRNAAEPLEAVELHAPRPCYTCKVRFRKLHHFYSQLCPECATLNYAKRLHTADLAGRTFLVTGGRVKIGFQCVLKLLRCGASVMVTSRFPADTAARFAAAADSDAWLPRLRCYGLDLRDLSAIERLCAHLIRTGERLDGIINNACQTIRRPATYYAHLIPYELQPEEWSAPVKRLLADHDRCFRAAPGRDAPARIGQGSTSAPALTGDAGGSAGGDAGGGAGGNDSTTATGGSTSAATPTSRGGAPPAASFLATAPAAEAMAAVGVPSALWSQAPLWSAEEGVMQPDEGTAANFPLGVRDVNGQQLDTRRTNSWLLKLGDVSTPEAAEVLAINTLAPFILNSRLRGLLEQCPAEQRFVVNVSAMEGKFYRYKTANHPHTNSTPRRGDRPHLRPPDSQRRDVCVCVCARLLPVALLLAVAVAKAALNMMTRTCAEDLAAVGVYMNSVDTGWINDEKPMERAAAHAENHHFQTPLDEVDAASRVLDPVLSAINGEAVVHGKFLKDYRAVEW